MAPDHPITKHLAVGYWKGGDLAVEEVLYQPQHIEKIVAWGGLASVKHVTRYIQPGLELIALDPKRSATIIGAEAFTDEATMREVARRAAIDIGVANQEGCANARVIYVLCGTDDAGLAKANKLGELIYQELVALPPFISTPPLYPNRDLFDHLESSRMTDDFYRVFGGEQREGAIVVSQFDEPVDYSPMLSGRVANIVPVDDIDKVTARGQRLHPDHRHLPGIAQTSTARHPSAVRGATADQPGLRVQCRHRHAPGRHRADPPDVQVDRRRGMRSRGRHPAVAPGSAGWDPAVNRAERRKNELRERILAAAFELFLSQGVSATRIDEICERADIASRTFFNHFPTRQDMVRALAESRLVNLHDVVFARSDEPIPQRLVGVFDDIATTLVDSGETYREMIGEMMAAADYGAQRGSPFHDTFVELVKDGLARGEIHTRHDPQIVADIIVGALSGALANWRVDTTYSLLTNLHNLGLALADLLVGWTDEHVWVCHHRRRRDRRCRPDRQDRRGDRRVQRTRIADGGHTGFGRRASRCGGARSGAVPGLGRWAASGADERIDAVPLDLARLAQRARGRSDDRLAVPADRHPDQQRGRDVHATRHHRRWFRVAVRRQPSRALPVDDAAAATVARGGRCIG